MKNPTTHPNEFVACSGEIVKEGAVYFNKVTDTWNEVSGSIDSRHTHVPNHDYQIYNPIMSINPNTHPNKFFVIKKINPDGLIPAESFYSDNFGRNWSKIGNQYKTCKEFFGMYPDNYQLAIPVNNKPNNPKTESNQNMSLQSVAILHTPKTAPGAIQGTEEILVGSTEVSALDNSTAIALVAAKNAKEILEVSKTSTFRVVVKNVG